MQQNEFFIVKNNLSDITFKKRLSAIYEVQVLEHFNKNIKF